MLPGCNCALCERCDTDKSRGKRDLDEEENWRKKEREQANQLMRLSDSETRDFKRLSLLHYIIDYEKPSHSSSSSASESTSLFLFAPFTGV